MKIYSYIEYQWNKDRQNYELVCSVSEEYYGKLALCGGKGGGGDGGGTVTVRYASYIETKHKDFLNTLQLKRNVAIQSSPFTDYVDIDVENAFFGAGYMIANFPSLYDMFGKFMAGLDIEVLWTQEFNDTVNSPVVGELIAAEGALLDDEIETSSLPKLQTGMRDINSVMSSSYIVAKTLLEDTRTKALAKFSAELKYRLIGTAHDRWVAHLNWNKGVIMTYAELMKFYYLTKIDVNEANYSMEVKDRLWPFTILDYERAGLGALQGATKTETDVAGASKASKALGGALAGGVAGAMIAGASEGAIAGPVGAVVGGAVGLAAGLLS